ncbi:MAG: YkgJ family cysteine cluster protein, partial [Chloroflexota bacterium]|nr:YkgJ family cysteine cluster protein [Chloroflexota bacterium]
ERIIYEGLGGAYFGLCLFPGEERLFEAFPDAIVPYIGLRNRAGKPRVEIICYQMIKAPCPLYDTINKVCNRYDDRPRVCRSYPFSGLSDGYSLEQHCSWVKVLGEVEFGKTMLRAGAVSDAAIADDHSFFISLNERMQRTGERLLIYDMGETDAVWLEPVRSQK